MPLCLLDTDILSEVLKRKHPAVVHSASAYLARQPNPDCAAGGFSGLTETASPTTSTSASCV